MTESYFRGFHAIGEVAEKVKKLAEHQAKYHASAPTLRLFRKDYDLVARWPNAGKLHGFEYVEEGVIKFMGYVLSYDRTAPRYQDRENTGARA